MANTFKKIQTVTVGSGGAASIDFTSIPQTFTDLKIVMSLRSTGTGVSTRYAAVSFNSNTSNYTYRRIYGNGSSTGSDNGSLRIIGTIPGSTVTASVFGSIELYVPNYTSANNKSYSCDSVEENNAAGAEQDLIAGLWSNTAAITSVTLTSDVGNFAEYSTATLYGVADVPAAGNAKATGGIITYDDTYVYHTFPFSGTFTPLSNLTADYLVVAGGGGAGGGQATDVGSGGGGAGGLRCTVGATGGGGSLESALSLTANTGYTVTVGAGGAGGFDTAMGTNGSNSVFSTITSTGGGGGARFGANGSSGGSGGGGGSNSSSGGAGTANQGFAGASGLTGGAKTGGGGGGAGVAGTAGSSGGHGGNGVTTSISGTSTTYAGGGGGGAGASGNGGTGGTGGGANGSNYSGNGNSATANTGGGGGGASAPGSARTGGTGGSGIVIVRYAK
jgi:hypothetical protein